MTPCRRHETDGTDAVPTAFEPDDCKRRFPMLRILTTLLALAVAPAAAKDSLILSPCQPGGAPVTEAEMAGFLEGAWQMSAAGTGFTTGTNLMTVMLRADPGSGRLMMEGQGMSVPLHPVGLARDVGAGAPAQPEFDIAVESLTPDGLSRDDITVLTGCERPLRYWWSMGSGARSSWGALMFVGDGMASGYMANSAGGSRNVMMTR